MFLLRSRDNRLREDCTCTLVYFVNVQGLFMYMNSMYSLTARNARSNFEGFVLGCINKIIMRIELYFRQLDETCDRVKQCKRETESETEHCKTYNSNLSSPETPIWEITLVGFPAENLQV